MKRTSKYIVNINVSTALDVTPRSTKCDVNIYNLFCQTSC